MTAESQSATTRKCRVGGRLGIHAMATSKSEILLSALLTDRILLAKLW